MTTGALARTLSLYRRTLDQTVYIRRYTGQGSSRTYADTQCSARVSDKLRVRLPDEPLVGNISQQSMLARVFLPDLTAAGFDLPITVNDKLLRADKAKEYAIIAADDASYAVGDTVIAADLNIRG